MKKLILVLILPIIGFIGCEKEAANISTNPDRLDNLSIEEQMEIARKDPNLVKFKELGDLLTSQDISDKEFNRAFDDFIELSKKVETSYFFERLERYAEVEAEKSLEKRAFLKDRCGDKCHLNCNGTVNREDCNFFERLLVFAGSTTCPRTNFAQCTQDIVCGLC